MAGKQKKNNKLTLILILAMAGTLLGGIVYATSGAFAQQTNFSFNQQNLTNSNWTASGNSSAYILPRIGFGRANVTCTTPSTILYVNQTLDCGSWSVKLVSQYFATNYNRTGAYQSVNKTSLVLQVYKTMTQTVNGTTQNVTRLIKDVVVRPQELYTTCGNSPGYRSFIPLRRPLAQGCLLITVNQTSGTTGSGSWASVQLTGLNATRGIVRPVPMPQPAVQVGTRPNVQVNR